MMSVEVGDFFKE